MTELLYLKEHYVNEFESIIKDVDNNKIILDKTYFFPTGGGQPSDIGKIIRNNEIFNVLNVRKEQEKIIHEVDKEGLNTGDKIVGKIDWERRYKLMKAHTAAHIISEVVHKETQAVITGNQINIDKVRIDFSLDNFNKEKMQKFIEKANEIIKKDLPVTTEFKSREEAIKIPKISKLAIGLPESIKEVRIVKIGDFDMQADGGTHVKSTKEIGKLELLNTENKGKNNRRLYFKLI